MLTVCSHKSFIIEEVTYCSGAHAAQAVPLARPKGTKTLPGVPPGDPLCAYLRSQKISQAKIFCSAVNPVIFPLGA